MVNQVNRSHFTTFFNTTPLVSSLQPIPKSNNNHQYANDKNHQILDP
jgi:hypothetical protein